MSNYIFTCPGCNATVKYASPDTGAYNIRQALVATKWNVCIDAYAENTIWICPECSKLVNKLATELQSILKTDNVTLRSLIKNFA